MEGACLSLLPPTLLWVLCRWWLMLLRSLRLLLSQLQRWHTMWLLLLRRRLLLWCWWWWSHLWLRRQRLWQCLRRRQLLLVWEGLISKELGTGRTEEHGGAAASVACSTGSNR